jgi:N-acetylneuraminic acid mutarotase
MVDMWYTGLEDMPTPRLTFATASVDGKIYAMGGRTTPQGVAIDTVEMYDPATDTWAPKSSMGIPRVLFGATAVNGKIYAIGGASFNNGLVFSAVEEYDPQTDMWTTKSDMPTPRHSFDIAAVNGKIYACGGDTTAGTGGETDAVEEYDPATDTWVSVADLPTPRSAFSACELNDKLYIVSGSEAVFPHDPLTTSLLEYDPNDDTWRERAPIPTARAFFAAVSVGEHLYAIGGSPTSFPFTPSAVVEAYTPPVTGIVDNLEENIVEIFTLHQNFPNPFNPTTTIAFDLPERGFVTLKIFDIAGHEVRTLVNGHQSAGTKTVVWDGRDHSGRLVSSGIYVYQLQAGNEVRSRKMLLVR